MVGLEDSTGVVEIAGVCADADAVVTGEKTKAEGAGVETTGDSDAAGVEDVVPVSHEE